MRARNRSFTVRILLAALTCGVTGVWALHSASAQGTNKAAKPKQETGFGDPRRGDVPEGAADMITPDTERAINSGLAWLGRSQNSDGSFGNGTYRGNIAVTSLAGLAFMASGSSPGRGP